jgi:hypothetical protein
MLINQDYRKALTEKGFYITYRPKEIMPKCIFVSKTSKIDYKRLSLL